MEHTCLGLGMISGSSLDGVDIAAVRFTIAPHDDTPIRDWNLMAAQTLDFPIEIHQALTNCKTLSASKLSALHGKLGRWMGHGAQEFMTRHGIQADYIASHGHTVFHRPDLGFTVQIGNAADIAMVTGCQTIADLRSADIAAGGQGAPLAPVVEHYCFPGHAFYLNIGGIANLSFHTPERVVAWDICPANQLLNHLARLLELEYDDGGSMARTGNINEALLNALEAILPLPMARPYAMDNAFVENQYLPILANTEVSIPDKMRTCVEFISQSISTQVASLLPLKHASLLVSGGGTHHHFLIERLNATLRTHGVRLEIPNPAVIDFKEAILIALCGVLRLYELPNSFSSVTGARHDTVNGILHVGGER